MSPPDGSERPSAGSNQQTSNDDPYQPNTPVSDDIKDFSRKEEILTRLNEFVPMVSSADIVTSPNKAYFYTPSKLSSEGIKYIDVPFEERDEILNNRSISVSMLAVVDLGSDSAFTDLEVLKQNKAELIQFLDTRTAKKAAISMAHEADMPDIYIEQIEAATAQDRQDIARVISLLAKKTDRSAIDLMGEINGGYVISERLSDRYHGRMRLWEGPRYIN